MGSAARAEEKAEHEATEVSREQVSLSTAELAATAAPKVPLAMEKAHLYEELYLVNHAIDEVVRGAQRLKQSPSLFMETYHKSMAGLERRRAIINLQFMLEMRKLEAGDGSCFEEEFNVWLSDEPLTTDEICQLVRESERQWKHEGKLPLIQLLTSSKRSKKTEKENEAVQSNHKPNGTQSPSTGVKSTDSGDTHG